MHLLAQPPLRADAEAIAYQQHADDQFRIDRGPARLAVEGPQLLAQTRQVYEPIDRTKQVIRWHVSLKAKAIEQRLLHHGPLAHHQPVSPSRRLLNQDLTTSSSPIFSTPSAESGMTAFEAETLESCHSPASFRPNYSAPSRSLRSGPHCPKRTLHSRTPRTSAFSCLISTLADCVTSGGSIVPYNVDLAWRVLSSWPRHAALIDGLLDACRGVEEEKGLLGPVGIHLMLEVLLCSLLTVFPDYLFRRYVQGKRLGKEITFYSVWYELRWGITACLMLTVGLITVVFYYHPSTKTATFLFRTVPIVPETIGRVAEINVSMSDDVAQGQQLFRLDDSKQRATVETARRKIAEVDAALMVARSDIQAAEGKIQEARSAHQQALDELETKQELFRRNPGIVPRRDIESSKSQSKVARRRSRLPPRLRRAPR